MRATLRRASTAVLVAATAALVVGCGSSDEQTDGPGTLLVVASTNVWGDVAKQIGGERVDVVSVISDPEADPHSYEATGQNQLALSKAALVIENGGGYDDFMVTMLSSSSASGVPVINAVDVSGHRAAAGQELNEHVWYDLPTVDKVARGVATRLAEADPGGTAEYAANAKVFGDKLLAIEKDVAAVKAAHQGTGVAVTEPVPLYLVQAAGLDNLTPEQFSAAVEQDTDVPPAVLQDTVALFADGKVTALFYNQQTGGPQTQALIDAARNNSIAAVPMRETLPAGQDFLTWMRANVTAMARAVGG